MINCSLRGKTMKLNDVLEQKEVDKEQLLTVDMKEMQRKHNMTGLIVPISRSNSFAIVKVPL